MLRFSPRGTTIMSSGSSTSVCSPPIAPGDLETAGEAECSILSFQVRTHVRVGYTGDALNFDIGRVFRQSRSRRVRKEDGMRSARGTSRA
jgi:hypothetical protein